MTSKDPFAKFEMPIGLSDGVTIKLADTPASFVVRLPGTMNEDFNMKLLVRMNMEVREGEQKIDGLKLQSERKKLFFEECILDASGLPKGMTSSEFFERYPLAARSIFEQAQILAVSADEVARDALEKSKPMPNGQSSGVGNMTNTTKSSKRVSKSAQSAPN